LDGKLDGTVCGGFGMWTTGFQYSAVNYSVLPNHMLLATFSQGQEAKVYKRMTDRLLVTATPPPWKSQA